MGLGLGLLFRVSAPVLPGEQPMPLLDDPAPVADDQIAWEAPGSSHATAWRVGVGAIVGAAALVWVAPYVLPAVGFTDAAWAVQAALAAAGGIGAWVGSWVAWAAFGKA